MRTSAMVLWLVACGCLCVARPLTAQSRRPSPPARTGEYRGVRLTPLPDAESGEALAINDRNDVAGWIRGPHYLPVPVIWDARDSVTALDMSGATSGIASGINDRGDVVGTLYSLAGTTIATRWSHGARVALLPLPDDASSAAFAISASGVTVGTSSSRRITRAVVWDSTGVARELHPPGTRWTQSAAYAISDSAGIVGSVTDAQGAVHAARWDRAGTMTLVGMTTSSIGEAFAISDGGSIGGTAADDTRLIAFVLSAAAPVQRFMPSRSSAVRGVNRDGRAVGWESGVPNDGPYPFVAAPGRPAMLLPATAAKFSGEGRAFAVNSCGTIVGSQRYASLAFMPMRWRRQQCEPPTSAPNGARPAR